MVIDKLLTLEFLVKIIGAIIVVAVFYYIGKIIESQIKKSRIEAPPEIVYNIARVTRVVVIVIGILVALSILEVNLSGILIAAGFAGLVVGLAAQQTLGQLFAGIALILEGRIKIGDSVKIGNDWGIVEYVGLLSTRIRLWSGEVLTIPNSNVMNSNIYNYSVSIARRAEVVVGISYNSDINKAIQVIKRVLEEKELVLAVPPPTIIVDNLGDSAVVLKVLYWTPSQEYWSIRREIIREIKEALEKEGIEIPFPQRVLWVKTPVKIESGNT